jgi:hypothetical protein
MGPFQGTHKVPAKPGLLLPGPERCGRGVNPNHS